VSIFFLTAIFDKINKKRRQSPRLPTIKPMLNLEDLEIEYRFSPRRRSIGLTVTAEGKLMVAVPRGTPQTEIARALARHRRWIEQKAAERREAWGRLQKGTVHFLGRSYRLTTGSNGREPVSLQDGEIRVRLGRDGTLWPLLRAWLVGRAEAHLQARVAHYAPEMGVQARSAELREWRRRWGECHPDQAHLRFNWRLIMLPPSIIDYVVVHELAHLLAPGHNPRFWGVVAAVLPDYQARRRWLNRYGSPFLLWQP
jgi:predicted metal-dependent hydrolase